MAAVYVICRDYYSEGMTAPIVAAATRGEAEALLSVMQQGCDGTLALFEVPVWPCTMPTERLPKPE